MNTNILRIVNGKEVSIPVRLFGRKIHVLRGTTGRWDGVGYKKDGLYLTDERGNQNDKFEILAVSDDCKYFTPDHVGWFVQIPMSGISFAYPVGEKFQELIVKETYWDKRRDKGKYPPLCIYRKDD